MIDHAQAMGLAGILPSDAAEKQLYTTYLASLFRSLRFGLEDAHGKGMAMQVNYLMDKGGFAQRADQTFTLDLEKFKQGVRDLDHDLLTTPIGAARSAVGSSLTSVDLAGLTSVELAFALVLAAAAGGLVFALGLSERRRSFAIASALGASHRQLRGLVLAEASSWQWEGCSSA